MVKLYGRAAPRRPTPRATSETLNASVASPELAASKVWFAGLAPKLLVAVTTLCDNRSIGAAETAPVSTHQTTSRFTSLVYSLDGTSFERLQTRLPAFGRCTR
jgi:hypothetical protein